MYSLNTFDVVHGISFVSAGFAPFDIYALTAVVFAVEKATNRSIPIIKSAAGEGPDNMAVTSFDIPASSVYTYNPGTGPTTGFVDSSIIYIEVRRSLLAKVFTLCLLIVNISLALGSTYITFVAFARRGEKRSEGIFLLPVTIILTIPALRGLYVGSPPFGIYLGRSQALRPQISDLSSRTDAALRYIWVLPADDGSRAVLYDAIVRRCYAAHGGPKSLP